MFRRIQNESLKKDCIWVRIRGAFLAKKGAPKLNFHREGRAVAPICPPLNPPLKEIEFYRVARLADEKNMTSKDVRFHHRICDAQKHQVQRTNNFINLSRNQG